MNHKKFLISYKASIKDALKKINLNHYGIVFIIDKDDSMIGIATDGDIRRSLINDLSLNDKIVKSMNKHFVFENESSSREMILKKLDNKIKVIPILDSKNKVKAVITKDNYPHQLDNPLYARARSPVRISFTGGGSDTTRYFEDSNGAVISATISLYSHASLRKRTDNIINVYSGDLDESISFTNLKSAIIRYPNFGLILSALMVINPNYGFDLSINSDFPIASGLGGSSAVTASIFGCFNELRMDKWNQYELSELAFQSERIHFEVAGGWQDQYATIFGGFNLMEFNKHENLIHPLRIDRKITNELEESIILFNTKTIHESGIFHNDNNQVKLSNKLENLLQHNVELTYKARNFLLKGNLIGFGKILNEAWSIKKQLSDKISNKLLNDMYDMAITNGAIGGKLLGSGGGGFFIFFVPVDKKLSVIDTLTDAGLELVPYRFDEHGMCSWSIRENI